MSGARCWEAYQKLYPKPKSVTELKEALQVICMGQPATAYLAYFCIYKMLLRYGYAHSA